MAWSHGVKTQANGKTRKLKDSQRYPIGVGLAIVLALDIHMCVVLYLHLVQSDYL